MSTSNFTEFNLPRNAYTAFDATSLKQLITNRVKNSGLFPDIDFEGSNINGIVDVFAFTFHVFMFYLNQTASDSLFTQAELYENMNKIVSLIGYKVQGNSTSTLNVSVTADNTIPIGSYTIQRFSNITTRGITYSTNSDITFQKTLSGVDQEIESIGSNNLLYQGTFREYPQYTAIGESFEQFTVNIDYPSEVGNKMVDGNNISVFVKDINKQKWYEWAEVVNLYLAESTSMVFEKRLNEFGHYEIKFGNDINGRKLQTGDIVAIYYLESDGNSGIIGTNILNEGKMVLFNSTQSNEIFTDIADRSDYLTAQQMLGLKFNNTYASIPPSFIETVESIRTNAPSMFSAQNRAVTTKDYESFVSKNFSGIVQSTKVVNNKDYTTEYLSYYYDLGLERPNLDGNVLFNQISFNDACDFNNVYVFCVPRLAAIQDETTPIELFFSQKQSIVDKLESYRMLNQNVVISDPVYVAFDFGLTYSGETATTDIRNDTILRITRSTEQVISKEQIKSSVNTLIKNFFSQSNNNLQQFLDFNQLSFDILSINGVKNLETVRGSGTTSEFKVAKMNFLYWNPLYPDANVQTTSQNINLKFFEFPFLYEVSNLINKIEIV